LHEKGRRNIRVRNNKDIKLRGGGALATRPLKRLIQAEIIVFAFLCSAVHVGLKGPEQSSFYSMGTVHNKAPDEL
jgi:hypothetical protein